MKKKPELESSVEKYLKDQIEIFEGLCLKWVSPGCRGVPDRIIFLPGGRIIFAELKRSALGRPDPLQEYRIKQLATMGQDVRLLYGREDVKALITEIREEMPV